MNPKKYISKNETLLYSFYESTKLLSLQITAVLILFSALTYFYWIIFNAWMGAVVVGSFLIFHIFFIYFNTWYFVTNKKIYKRTGYVWTKLIQADISDIADTKLSQNLFEKLLGMGKLYFNTSGSNKIEIIFKNIDNPFETKNKITNIMNN